MAKNIIAENNHIRLLAAIMFADIVGYTKMMQEDEGHAKSLRDHQRSVIETYLLKYHGQVMQYYGDGTLIMFGSALDAVKCARDIQVELVKHPTVPLRIGIHIGDVAYDDEGIYGDAVNVASRIQSLGKAGSVMISENVFNEIKNHSGILVESFGEHKLKSITTPVNLYSLINENSESHKQSQTEEPNRHRMMSLQIRYLALLNGGYRICSGPHTGPISSSVQLQIINPIS